MRSGHLRRFFCTKPSILLAFATVFAMCRSKVVSSDSLMPRYGVDCICWWTHTPTLLTVRVTMSGLSVAGYNPQYSLLIYIQPIPVLHI